MPTGLLLPFRGSKSATGSVADFWFYPSVSSELGGTRYAGLATSETADQMMIKPRLCVNVRSSRFLLTVMPGHSLCGRVLTDARLARTAQSRRTGS
jgi:hypothetical protein